METSSSLVPTKGQEAGNTKPWLGVLLAIIGATLWGVSGTFGQFLFHERGVNVEWMITIRLLVAGSLLLLISSFDKRQSIFSIWTNRSDLIQLLIFSIAGMVTIQYTYFAAINYSNAATATILQFLGAVIIALYISVKALKLPSLKELLALFLALVGTFLLVTHASFDNLAISPLGLTLGLASAVAVAIYSLQPAKLLRKYPAHIIVGWAMLVGGVLFSFVHAPWEIEGRWDVQAISYASFVVIFGTLIPFFAYLSAVKIVGGQTASLLGSAEPLSAAFMAVIWLQVPFGLMDWLGSACIISTIFILSMGKKAG